MRSTISVAICDYCDREVRLEPAPTPAATEPLPEGWAGFADPLSTNRTMTFDTQFHAEQWTRDRVGELWSRPTGDGPPPEAESDDVDVRAADDATDIPF